MDQSHPSHLNHVDSESKAVPHEAHHLDHLETTHEIAERGHAATDKLGRPVVEFDKAAEAKLRLKIDLYIVPTAFMLYLFCFIDRTNIGNARLVGFEKDLGLKGYDYNAVLSYFYISYILFEIPANMLCKWMGPGWFLPICTVGFGVSSLAYAYVKDIHSAAGVRFLLGAFEAGLLPGLAYYLSRWYRRSELVFRLSLYIVAAPLAGAFGGLLASGILKLTSVAGLRTWRMIFFIEGIITIGVGIVALFTMTDRPGSARWLSEEEKDLAISRLKSERVGVTEVLDRIDKPKLLRGMFCPITLATSWIFLLINITVQGLSIFAPTIIRTIYPKHTVISQQLHTVPLYIAGAVLTVAISFASWKYDRRTLFMLISGPLIVIGYVMFLATNNPQVRFGATFLIAGGAFPFGALCNAHVSANVVSDTARSSAIATNVMMGNLGGLISTWSFLPRDAPNFPIGNGLNLASSTLVVITAAAMLVWMKFDNEKRENVDVSSKLTGLSQKQIQDMDWRHPAFKWKL